MTWGGVIKRKKIIIFSVLIIIVAILSIVVINNVTNKSYAASNYLYDAVEADIVTNGYGGTYTGDHADTVESSGEPIVGDENIYYYNTKGYGKVKFAGYCWQIMRTTDTGGVKLIYEDEYDSVNKCNNDRYIDKEKNLTENQSVSSGDYVGSSYSFDSSTGSYTLTGDVKQINSFSSSIGGYYMCLLGGRSCSSSYAIYKLPDSPSGTSAKCSLRQGLKHGVMWSQFRNGTDCTNGDARCIGYKYYNSSTNEVNVKDSQIKTNIDSWYESNLSSYESYLEDTIFCNDRLGSTNENSSTESSAWYGGTTSQLKYYYRNYYRNNYEKLYCGDYRDRFTTNNNNAKLDYPIGLISSPEVYLSNGILSDDTEAFTISPSYSGNSYIAAMQSTRSSNDVNREASLRPSVSLTPNIILSGGNGTPTNPYVVGELGLGARVKYNAGSNGTLSGTVSEDVSSGGHPTGRNVTPNSGYYFAGWVANKNVTLSNNTTISKGTVMTKAQTQSIVVSSSITLTAKYYKGYLYDKVEQDATTNGYGETYSGDHADTVTSTGAEIVGDKNIYYYTTAGHNDVKLGGFCWKIIRTTDTGGVKLLYNGVFSSSDGCSVNVNNIGKSTYGKGGEADAKYFGYKYSGALPLEESFYTNISNDSTYPYEWSNSDKTWTSTNHTNSKSASIEFKVKTAGDYKFNYTVSSESSYDKAYFYKNGTAICSSSSGISGEKTSTCDLTGLTTSDVIKVKYTKDGSSSSGSDNVIFYLGTTEEKNLVDSTMKTYIDSWYESNLTSYESYLEDIVFCNDRSGSTVKSEAMTGTEWKGSGYLSSSQAFYYHNSSGLSYKSLACMNEYDRFNVTNNKAKLTHPIALISAPEFSLTNDNGTSGPLYNGYAYWSLSPYQVWSTTASLVVINGSSYYTVGFGSSLDVRPVVSLAPNITYTGSGSPSDPYDVSSGIIEPSLTATFYYQSSSTNGTTNISSVTTSCTPSGGSCSAEIPSAVRSSVGTYNNSYAGLNTSTGSMSTPVGSSATTVTLTSDATYYAVYRSSVTNYYYSN